MNKISKINKWLNDSINRSSNWKIFFVSLPILTIFLYVLWYLMFRYASINPYDPNVQRIMSFNILLKMSLMLSVVFSAMITLMFSMSKQSDKFWGSVHNLEKLIDETNTKEGLEKLYENDFKETNKLSMGGAHYTEMKRLDSVIKTKYKYIK